MSRPPCVGIGSSRDIVSMWSVAPFRLGLGHEFLCMKRRGLIILVGGAAVRSATGSGDGELRPVEWPVEDLVGSRARLELVDEDPEGYLLADDLTAPVR